MASYPTVDKAIGEVVHNANLEVLNKFMDNLKETIDTESLEAIGELMNEFKETLKTQYTETQKKLGKKNSKGLAKKDKPKRAPSAYNKFIGEQMRVLKESNPEATSQERMTMAMSKWKMMDTQEKAQYHSKVEAKASDTETETEVVETDTETEVKVGKKNGKKTKA